MPVEITAVAAPETDFAAAAPGAARPPLRLPRELLARAYRLMHTAAAMADLY